MSLSLVEFDQLQISNLPLYQLSFDPLRKKFFAFSGDKDVSQNDWKQGSILVVDAITHKICYEAGYSNCHLMSRFIPSSDKFFVAINNKVAIRSAYEGKFMLHGIDESVVTKNEVVTIELPLNEAEELKEAIKSEVNFTHQEVKNLCVLLESKLKEKVANNEQLYENWATISIPMKFSDWFSAVSEMYNFFTGRPVIGIVSAIWEKLIFLHPSSFSQQLPWKTMNSEHNRLLTFKQWPHPEYKHATPEKLASAGFYHAPVASPSFSDRCHCFWCGIALVSWEPTDEAWIEHARHSPKCNLIVGKPTPNIPLAVTLRNISTCIEGVKNVSFFGFDESSEIAVVAGEDGGICLLDTKSKLHGLISFNCFHYDKGEMDSSSVSVFDFIKGSHISSVGLVQSTTIKQQDEKTESNDSFMQDLFDDEFIFDDDMSLYNDLTYGSDMNPAPLSTVQKKQTFEGQDAFTNGVISSIAIFSEDANKEKKAKNLYILVSLCSKNPQEKGSLLRLFSFQDGTITPIQYVVCREGNVRHMEVVRDQKCLFVVACIDDPIGGFLFRYEWNSLQKNFSESPIRRAKTSTSILKLHNIGEILEKNMFLGLRGDGSLSLFDSSLDQLYHFDPPSPFTDVIFWKYSDQVFHIYGCTEQGKIHFLDLKIQQPEPMEEEQFCFTEITTSTLKECKEILSPSLLEFTTNPPQKGVIANQTKVNTWKITQKAFENSENELAFKFKFRFPSRIFRVEVDYEFLNKNTTKPSYDLSLEIDANETFLSRSKKELQKYLQSIHIQDHLRLEHEKLSLASSKMLQTVTESILLKVKATNLHHKQNELKSIAINIFGQPFESELHVKTISLIQSREYILRLLSTSYMRTHSLKKEILDLLLLLVPYCHDIFYENIHIRDFIDINLLQSDASITKYASVFLKNLARTHSQFKLKLLEESFQLLPTVVQSSSFVGVRDFFSLLYDLDQDHSFDIDFTPAFSTLDDLSKTIYEKRSPFYALLYKYYSLSRPILEPSLFYVPEISEEKLPFTISSNSNSVMYDRVNNKIVFDHAYGNRWVVLDFGSPCLLTGVCFDTNPSIAQIHLDVWTEGENIDAKRVLLGFNLSKEQISMKNLRHECRYLKISIYVEYSHSGTSLSLDGIFGIEEYISDLSKLSVDEVKTLALKREEKVVKKMEEFQNASENLKSELMRDSLQSEPLKQVVNFHLAQLYDKCEKAQRQLSLSFQLFKEAFKCVKQRSEEVVFPLQMEPLLDNYLDKLMYITQNIVDFLLNNKNSWAEMKIDDQLLHDLFRNLCICSYNVDLSKKSIELLKIIGPLTSSWHNFPSFILKSYFAQPESVSSLSSEESLEMLRSMICSSQNQQSESFIMQLQLVFQLLEHAEKSGDCTLVGWCLLFLRSCVHSLEGSSSSITVLPQLDERVNPLTILFNVITSPKILTQINIYSLAISLMAELLSFSEKVVDQILCHPKFGQLLEFIPLKSDLLWFQNSMLTLFSKLCNPKTYSNENTFKTVQKDLRLKILELINNSRSPLTLELLSLTFDSQTEAFRIQKPIVEQILKFIDISTSAKVWNLVLNLLRYSSDISLFTNNGTSSILCKLTTCALISPQAELIQQDFVDFLKHISFSGDHQVHLILNAVLVESFCSNTPYNQQLFWFILQFSLHSFKENENFLDAFTFGKLFTNFPTYCRPLMTKSDNNRSCPMEEDICIGLLHLMSISIERFRGIEDIKTSLQSATLSQYVAQLGNSPNERLTVELFNLMNLLISKNFSIEEQCLVECLSFMKENACFKNIDHFSRFCQNLLHNEKLVQVFSNIGGLHFLCKEICKYQDDPMKNASLNSMILQSLDVHHEIPNGQLHDYAPLSTIISSDEDSHKIEQVFSLSGNSQPRWSKQFKSNETDFSVILRLPDNILLHEVHVILSTPIVCIPGFIEIFAGCTENHLAPIVKQKFSPGIRTDIPFPGRIRANFIRITIGKPEFGDTISLSRITILGSSLLQQKQTFEPSVQLPIKYCVDILGQICDVSVSYISSAISSLSIPIMDVLQSLHKYLIISESETAEKLLLSIIENESVSETFVLQQLLNLAYSIDKSKTNARLLGKISDLHGNCANILSDFVFSQIEKNPCAQLCPYITTFCSLLSNKKMNYLLTRRQLELLLEAIFRGSIESDSCRLLICTLCENNIKNFELLLEIFHFINFQKEFRTPHLSLLAYSCLSDATSKYFVQSVFFQELTSNLYGFLQTDPKTITPQTDQQILAIMDFLSCVAHAYPIKEWFYQSDLLERLLVFCQKRCSLVGFWYPYCNALYSLFASASNCHDGNQNKAARIILSNWNLLLSNDELLKNFVIKLLSYDDNISITFPSLLKQQISQNESPLFPNSSILSHAQGTILNSFVNKINSDISPHSQWKRIWKMDKFQWGDFKEKCFGVSPIIIVILTNNSEVIGGYISQQLKHSTKKIMDKDAFIFNLDRKTLFRPTSTNKSCVNVGWSPGGNRYISWGKSNSDLLFSLDSGCQCFQGNGDFICSSGTNERPYKESFFFPSSVEVWTLEENKNKKAKFPEKIKENVSSPFRYHSTNPVISFPLSTPIPHILQEFSIFQKDYIYSLGSLPEGKVYIPAKANLAFLMQKLWRQGLPHGVEFLSLHLEDGEQKPKSEPEETFALFSSALRKNFANDGLSMLVEYKLSKTSSHCVWLEELHMFSKIGKFGEMFLESKECRDLLLKLFQSDDIPSSLLDNEKETEISKLLIEIMFKILEISSYSLFNVKKEILKANVLNFMVKRMAFLSAVSKDDPTSSPKQQEDSKKKDSTEEKEKKAKTTSYWEKGTGFGYGGTSEISSWNQEFFILQAKKSKEIEKIFLFISRLIGDKEESPELEEQILEAFQNSLLYKVLESYLRNDSFLEMAKQLNLYKSVMKFLKTLSFHPKFLVLLQPTEEPSLFVLLENMSKQAELLVNRLEKEMAETEEPTVELAKVILETHKLMQEKIETEKVTKKAAKEEQIDGQSIQERYCSALSELLFDMSDMKNSSGSFTHHYNNFIMQDQAPTTKMVRLAQEIGVLSNSLPLSWESSIFLRTDEERMDVMKVLITGPVGTPYSNGCFLFDIYFPKDYPSVPPLVNLETTGNGTVRFNPNLYANGKVCLSLLGTWNGAVDEMWNPKTSTLLQVLVSIQSLILVPDPYFNEPGYEKTRGTSQGKIKSIGYNQPLKVATIQHAMLGHLRSPPPGFEEVIKLHFYHKKEEIYAQCEQWLEEGKSNQKHFEALSRQVSLLKKELEELEL